MAKRARTMPVVSSMLLPSGVTSVIVAKKSVSGVVAEAKKRSLTFPVTVRGSVNFSLV